MEANSYKWWHLEYTEGGQLRKNCSAVWRKLEKRASKGICADRASAVKLSLFMENELLARCSKCLSYLYLYLARSPSCSGLHFSQSISSTHLWTYTVSKKNCTNGLCQNFVKCPSILIMFGKLDDRIAKVLYHIYISHLTQLISPHYLFCYLPTKNY